MDWPFALLIILGSFLFFMATGMPVAFAFMLTCVLGTFLFLSGFSGMQLMPINIYSSLASFILLPLPLFILMGEIIFTTGVGNLMVETVAKFLGRIPGRLSLIAVGAGVLLGTLTGVSMASVVILGRSLMPEMRKRGYKNDMTLGPIVGSGALAAMIPPSGLAVFIGAIGEISITKLLIAIIIPGLLMAFLFGSYIIIRCALQPSLAPAYSVPRTSITEKLLSIVRYILPLGIVIFAVIGAMILGIATPTEAAALGAIACYILASIYRKLNLPSIKRSAINAIETSVMILMIAAAAITFSRILSITGTVTALVQIAVSFPVAPIVIIIATQVLVVFLGMFMGPSAIVMITLPIFMPIVRALGFDPVWFGVMMLINLQVGVISPPYGIDVYVMKSISPSDVRLADVFRASMPFLALDLLAITIIMFVPQVALWLPSII